MNKEKVNRKGDKGNFTSLYNTKLITRRVLHNCKMMLKINQRNTKLIVGLKQTEHFPGTKVINLPYLILSENS